VAPEPFLLIVFLSVLFPHQSDILWIDVSWYTLTPLIIMATNAVLCINCRTNTKYFDPNTRKLHDFCSKSCANASTSKSLAVNTNCENCHTRPKHSDGTQTYPYCGRSCGQAAKLAGVKGLARRVTIGASPIPAGSGSGSCSIPRCYKQVYVGPDGKVSKFCNMSHQRWGESGCLYCRLADKAPDSHLCSKCINVVRSSAPMIVSIPEEHERFGSGWHFCLEYDQ